MHACPPPARTSRRRVAPHCQTQLLRLTKGDFDGKLHFPDGAFWLRQAVMLGGLGLVFISAGLMTVTTGFNAGYTRKICHLALFASSPLMMFLWPANKASSSGEALWGALWTVWTSFAPFYFFIKPVRRRFTAALLCFRAIDREEDRPYTLEWLVSQGVAGLVAIVAIMIFMAIVGGPKRQALVLIPIIINGIGDGLAEPVGIAFGRHKYKTRALWYHGQCCAGSFTRSLEARAHTRTRTHCRHASPTC
jgi:phytol kinase